MVTSGISVGETPTQLALLVKTLLDLQGLEVPVRLVMTVSPKCSFYFGLQCGKTYKVQTSDDSKGANIIVRILQSCQHRLTFRRLKFVDFV